MEFKLDNFDAFGDKKKQHKAHEVLLEAMVFVAFASSLALTENTDDHLLSEMQTDVEVKIGLSELR